jgi:acetyl esterase/lipase
LDWLHDGVKELRETYEQERRKPIPDWAAWERLGDAGNPIRILRHRPPNATGNATIIYFHGGGWILGSPETHADITAALSLSTGCELISVDYRLAPEHVAPAPVIDGLRVVEFVLSQDFNNVTPRKIVLCGDSAGAAIAMAVERLAKPDIREKILGVCSIYGAFGLLDSTSLRQWGLREDGLDVDCVHRFWALANVPGNVSPYAIESLMGSSYVPVYLLIAGRDPIRDDSLVLAENLKKIGRILVIDIVESEYHGFLHGVHHSSVAYIALEKIGAWINGLIHGAREMG